MNHQGRSWLLQAIACLGLAVSLYLYVAHLANNYVCPVGDCAAVNNSSYAKLGGVPLSVWGMIYYAVLFALAAQAKREAFHRLTRGMLAFGLLFSMYLTYLELFVIRAVCFWCVVSLVLIVAGNLVANWKTEKGMRYRDIQSR